jgi:GrpB-like predicted nucleotidyltransferase (UPF0157 family)/ribosomal protein S18 acetylase RimI-like enzyme
METIEEKLQRVLTEPIAIVDYDPAWPALFATETARLRRYFPPGVIRRLEHIGSTAVPGMAAKPIVDILIGVDDVRFVHETVAAVMEAAGYDYFWRPSSGNDVGPFYPWFIGRDAAGQRVSHIHVVGMDNAEQWDRVLFRDYLRRHPQTADDYALLKRELARRLGADRERYTQEKSAFILRVTELARQETKDLLIRPMEHRDIEPVVELARANYDGVMADHHTSGIIARFRAEVTPQSFREQLGRKHVFVVEDAGELAATGALADFGTPSQPRFTVSQFYVRADLHRRGIGKRLLAHLEELARTAGARRLHVPSSRNAIAFYGDSGFTVDEAQPDAAVEITWMTKQLPS